MASQIQRILIAAWVFCACAAPVFAQVYTVDDFDAGMYTDSTGNTLPYRLFVPRGYDPTQKYPLMLFLHGAGERGTDNRLQLTGQTAELAYINQSATPVFMLAPQCPPGDQWVEVPFGQGSYSIADTPESPSLETALSLQSWVTKQYSIDTSRLYVTGLSMGGYGAWDISLRNPYLYAAVVPMSGAGDPTLASLLLSTPVWDFHGLQDGVVPVSGSRDMIEALQSLGGNPIYTEYPQGGHTIWDQAYNTPGLVSWTFAQQRQTINVFPVPESGASVLALVTLLSSLALYLRRRLNRKR